MSEPYAKASVLPTVIPVPDDIPSIWQQCEGDPTLYVMRLRELGLMMPLDFSDEARRMRLAEDGHMSQIVITGDGAGA